MKKLKYTKAADIIVKVACVAGGIFFIAAFCVSTDSPLFWIFFGLACICGLVIFIYPYIFDEESDDFSKEIKLKPDKFSVEFSFFQEFFEKAKISLESNELTQISSIKHDDYEMYLYATPKTIMNLDLVMIINAEEVTKELLDKLPEECIKCVEFYYKKSFNWISYDINLLTTFCVKRITPALRSLLSENYGLRQDYTLAGFLSAISFGRKNLYMVKQKGLIGKTKYKKCKNKFKKYFAFLFPEENEI
ncbi:MAG: hypothetical protein E7612_06820 [Ruminococcaceae bacterium]|nr:hypothetical protein [Oscillospiraceae bacterium]